MNSYPKSKSTDDIPKIETTTDDKPATSVPLDFLPDKPLSDFAPIAVKIMSS